MSQRDPQLQAALEAEELVHWCQRTLPHDTRAFEALVAQYKQRVFATTFRLMRNHADADDMAQETFIRVYRGLRDLKEPATLTSWIYRIAVNLCLDAIHKRRRAPQPIEVPEYMDEPMTPQSIDDITPETLALEHEARECIEVAIANLDSTSRSALVLRDIEDRPYQEIAEVLSVGLSAVKMRIHRARIAVKDLIEKLCPDVWIGRGPTRISAE